MNSIFFVITSLSSSMAIKSAMLDISCPQKGTFDRPWHVGQTGW